MTKNSDAALLAEFGRIIVEYGSQRVTALAERIRDPQWADELASLLDSMVNEHSVPEVISNPNGSGGVGNGVLRSLKSSDPEKYSAIEEIRQELATNKALATMADLRHFAFLYGLSIGNASSRKAAIPAFLRSLSDLPTGDVVALQDPIREFKHKDQCLESWRKVIIHQAK